MSTVRLITLVCCAVVGAAASCDPPTGNCDERPSATPTVRVEFGQQTLTALPPGAQTELVVGLQGGVMVWTGVHTTGFAREVDVELVARDAYSGALLANANVTQLAASALDGAPAGECVVPGLALLLFGRWMQSAGLADVTATVRDAAGRQASDTIRVWLGTRIAECLPDETSPPRLALLATDFVGALTSAPLVTDGAVLVPGGYPEAIHVGAAVRGFAASGVTLKARVFEEDGTLVLDGLEARAMTDRPAEAVPEVHPSTGDCAVPLLLSIGPVVGLTDRTLRLEVSADDGLGHSASASRKVSFRTGFSP